MPLVERKDMRTTSAMTKVVSLTGWHIPAPDLRPLSSPNRAYAHAPAAALGICTAALPCPQGGLGVALRRMSCMGISWQPCPSINR